MLGRQHPFSPSVPAEAGCLFNFAARVHVFSSGESLHCVLVGWCTNKSYVIATSDLWLFIHASNLLPSTPHPTPLQLIQACPHKHRHALTDIGIIQACTPTHRLIQACTCTDADLRSQIQACTHKGIIQACTHRHKHNTGMHSQIHWHTLTNAVMRSHRHNYYHNTGMHYHRIQA